MSGLFDQIQHLYDQALYSNVISLVSQVESIDVCSLCLLFGYILLPPWNNMVIAGVL